MTASVSWAGGRAGSRDLVARVGGGAREIGGNPFLKVAVEVKVISGGGRAPSSDA